MVEITGFNRSDQNELNDALNKAATPEIEEMAIVIANEFRGVGRVAALQILFSIGQLILKTEAESNGSRLQN